MNAPSKWIVVCGDENEYYYHGPFNTRGEAQAWAEQECGKFFTAELLPPAPQIKENLNNQ
jgi:hypothetical protein